MGFFKQSCFVLLVALAINYLPGYLVKKKPLAGHGFVAPKWRHVAKVFRENLESGLERGGAFAVYHKGKLVVDFVGGYADEEAGIPWETDTLGMFFSSTKGVSAIVIAVLVDRGLLNYSEPVAKYWPEFAQNGKEKITLDVLLSHQAGLAVIDEPFDINDLMNDPVKVGNILAKQKPLWKPGTKHGYHALSLGIYIDQLVRRVDPQHRSLSEFFHEEINEAFGVDFYIGLPRELYYRMARIRRQPLKFMTVPQALPMLLKFLAAGNDSLHTRVMANPKGFEPYDVPVAHVNNPAVLATPFGSALGFGTAASVAKLFSYVSSPGHHPQQRLISDVTADALTSPRVAGVECVFRLNVTFTRGMNSYTTPLGNQASLVVGAGGQLVLADPVHDIGLAYVTNNLDLLPSMIELDGDPRHRSLLKAVYDVVRKL